MSRFRPLCVIAACGLAACGGGGGSSNTPGPTAPPPVTVASVASVSVDHAGDSLPVGGTIQLSATARDASGNILSGRTVTWSTSSAATMTVSSSGLATGVALGNATISATIDNVAGGAALGVKRFLPYTFADLGRVLGASDLGISLSAGLGVGTADVSPAETPDGRVRIYFGVFDGSTGPGKIRSAISTDGVRFTLEAGLRHPANATPGEGFASAMIIALPSGGYRLFYNGCHPSGCGISSSTSVDGLTFVADPGLRLTSPNSDMNPSCNGIIKLTDGRYRLYCSVITSSFVVGIATIEHGSVFSAVSTDLLAWTVEPGFLIGSAAPTLKVNATHPTAILNADGSVSLVYYQRRSTDPSPHEMIATSKDGRTFDAELETGLLGTEPAFLKRTDGSILLYRGGNTPGESTIFAARATPVK